MEQKRLHNNIFTDEAREYLLSISGPRPGEMERVKKDIFQKLATRYPQPQIMKKTLFSDYFTFRFSFGFASLIVIVVCGAFLLSQDKQEQVANMNKSVSPSETVLVKNDGSTAPNQDLKTQSVASDSKDTLVQIVNQSPSRDIERNSKNSVPTSNSKPSSKAIPVTNDRLIRTEGMVKSASNNSRAIIPEISEMQIEYIVSSNDR